MMIRQYRRLAGQQAAHEQCFYINHPDAFTAEEMERLRWLLAEPLTVVTDESVFTDAEVLEIGPRLSVETPFSSNAVAICQSIGLPVRRIEMSVRYPIGDGLTISGAPNRNELLEQYLDRMTQAAYDAPLATFDSDLLPESVTYVDIIGRGEEALREVNVSLGLGMDDWDLNFWTEFFYRLKRDPTDVELMFLGNAMSEHSRHPFFRGIQGIDGSEMPESLMDVVREPLRRNPRNSIIAFEDNSSVTHGVEVSVFAPADPIHSSPFHIVKILQHITATAETHNHPTLKSPFQGATTGIGGMERDKDAVGRGANQRGASVAGYAVGNLHNELGILGEIVGGENIRADASPIEILIQGSNGVSDYGNKLGVPLIGGFTRTFGQIVSGERREFRKPVLYCGGTSRVLDMHFQKHSPEVGMLIVRIGGPAYRIGVGGGSASSMISGSNDAELDLKSVQRGNAEMQNRTCRAIRACTEMGVDNPIESIHDQGAGGPSNVLTELMEPVGGRVDIRKITVGDHTMSVLEIWVAEYQEGYGLLIRSENLEVFQAICDRERVNCEVLGEITGDGNVVVYDSADDTTPVDLSLSDILGKLPQKRFVSDHLKVELHPLVIPKDLTVDKALQMVFKLPQVGSKGFLVRKVDRSVTGLVVQQQCCGPTQVPVSDVAVTADGYFGLTGIAAALGEQPIKMLIDPAKGARMAVAEMLTNLASARITTLPDVKCRANWMWAAKRPGEGALLYDAAVAMRDIMLELGIAIDGGKDSLSMATMVGDDLVVSPGELVVMGYAPVPDITKVVTPDSKVYKGYVHGVRLIDLGQGKNRLGGSSLAQSLGQLGNESPDIDDSDLLRRAFEAVQEMVERGAITAYHDRSDGGLITALAEMCIASGCGARVHLPNDADVLAELFNEEAGILIEYATVDGWLIDEIMHKYRLPHRGISISTCAGWDTLDIRVNSQSVFDHSIVELRQWWEETSTQLEALQADPETVAAERTSHREARTTKYHLSFTPKAPNLRREQSPKVAILREEGTNGDREMAAAFYTAGFEPWDIAMSDLLDGRVKTFADVRGLVFPGGFSYADVFGSAKGWAGPIRFNSRVREMFDRFYERSDTFSLGVCNGCQLMANIGWLPYSGIAEDAQPRFVHNESGRFESRWVGVKVLESPSIMMRKMEGSVLGIWVAHGEGKLLFPDPQVAEEIRQQQLAPLAYVDPDGKPTETYPYNPNGSPEGWTALCSPDGRHLAMMPHPERLFLKWQWPWMPEEFRDLEASPWLQMFQNAYDWCLRG